MYKTNKAPKVLTIIDSRRPANMVWDRLSLNKKQELALQALNNKKNINLSQSSHSE